MSSVEQKFFDSLAKDKNFKKLNEIAKIKLLSQIIIFIDYKKQQEREKENKRQRAQELKLQREKEQRFELEKQIIKEHLFRKVKGSILSDFHTIRY